MGSERKNGGGGGGLDVPAAERKLVQNVREVLNKNCTDSEIYSVLRECNMDPNDAVQRLLAQDTFQEVKSKRERRKEMKEMQDSWPRVNHNGSQGGRVGSEHDVRCGGMSPLCYNEHNDAAYKREDEMVDPSLSSFSTFAMTFTGKSMNEQSLPQSYSFNADNRRQAIGTGVTVSSSGQWSSGLRPAWSRAATDHMSMADIVRVGRLKVKGTEILMSLDNEVPYLSHDSDKPPPVSAPVLSELRRDFHSRHSSNVKEVIHEGISPGHRNLCQEWCLNGLHDASDGLSELDAYAGSEPKVCSKQFYGQNKSANWPDNWHSDEVRVAKGDVAVDIVNIDCSISSGSSQVITTSCDYSLEDIGFYDSHMRMFEKQEALSSDAANVQCINLGKQSWPPKEDGNVVVLPDNVRELVADCSHLSFGTYKPDNAANFGLLASNCLKSNVAEASAEICGSSAGHGYRRTLGYSGEQLGFVHDAKKAFAHARHHDGPLSSQPEGSKVNISQQGHENKYSSPSSILDSKFNSIQHLSPAFSFATDPNARNHLVHPSEVRAYKDTDLFVTNVQSSRDLDHLHSALVAPTESARYSRTLSSLSSPSIAMTEVLNGTFATPHSSLQSVSATSRTMRPVPPQQLSPYSYSLPSHPSGEFESTVGYSSVCRNAYMPHATPQIYPDGNAFYDLSGLKENLPKYESGASRSNTSLCNAGASGYGGFRGSFAPGSIQHSLPTSLIGSGVGYDDHLHPQYKDRSYFTMVQQSHSSSAWDYAPGSRIMPHDLDSRYSSFMGQNQQLSALNRQSSESYGTSGCLNFYDSQTEITQEQKQQNFRDFMLLGSHETSSQDIGQFLQQRH